MRVSAAQKEWSGAGRSSRHAGYLRPREYTHARAALRAVIQVARDEALRQRAALWPRSSIGALDAILLAADKPAGVSAVAPARGIAGLEMRLQLPRAPHERLLTARLPCSRAVVRGGVEPPTFRFSGLRITVQDRPQRSLRLLTALRYTPVYVDV